MIDLIIGAGSNYTWKELKYWVNSIKKTDFRGDVMIVGTNMSKETIDKLTSCGIILKLYGKQNERGDISSPPSQAPHVDRFFYIWNALNTLEKEYRYVVTTDTRDVIFQKNPTDFLEEYPSELVVSGEGMTYIDEPWGKDNFETAFGTYFFENVKNKIIYNVGVIAGKQENVKSLMLMIFQLSINRPIPIVDQAVFNFILSDVHYSTFTTYFTSNLDGWAIQLGTTLEAVRTGAGDLGQKYLYDTTFKYKYADIQPHIDDNGKVTNINGTSFTIVHQYDRIPELKRKLHIMYGDENDYNDESGTIFHHPV